MVVMVVCSVLVFGRDHVALVVLQRCGLALGGMMVVMVMMTRQSLANRNRALAHAVLLVMVMLMRL